MDDQGAYVIRPLGKQDFSWLLEISKQAGIGFTSLPHNKDYIARRVDIVEKSFQQLIPEEERIYLFVRENVPSGERVGLCGIHANVGFHDAFYSYQISTITQISKAHNITVEHKIINLVTNFQHATELVSFWLHPENRGKHLSHTLALSRFLFIAQFPELFGKEVIAEIRGVSDENGNSPFWDAIGSHFFAMDFKTADAMTMTKGKQYIADLVSHEPIFLDLLPIAAQQVVGVAHPESEPARHFLELEGFEYNNYIDIFDGGPLLNIAKRKINTIAKSKLVTLAQCVDKINDGVRAVIFNARIDARITEGKLVVLDNGEVVIAQDLAKLLDVDVGEQVRYIVV